MVPFFGSVQILLLLGLLLFGFALKVLLFGNVLWFVFDFFLVFVSGSFHLDP